jgi:hypothetical protein
MVMVFGGGFDNRNAEMVSIYTLCIWLMDNHTMTQILTTKGSMTTNTIDIVRWRDGLDE